jgi:hypothetical protein
LVLNIHSIMVGILFLKKYFTMYTHKYTGFFFIVSGKLDTRQTYIVKKSFLHAKANYLISMYVVKNEKTGQVKKKNHLLKKN